MILRKPYAFFIKMFKPIHLLLAILTGYLIYMETLILSYYTKYIYSSVQNITLEINNIIYIIPIIVIAFSLMLLGIMYKKDKPYKFYFVNILVFIFIIIINVNALKPLDSIKLEGFSIASAKLFHDLILINIILECGIFTFFIVRCLGLDIKKFDFSSDLSKIEISDVDKEEIEVNIDINLDEQKRKRRKKLRDLKYLYYENRFFIIVGFAIFLLIAALFAYKALRRNYNVNSEGFTYSSNNYNVQIVSSYIIDENYNLKKYENFSLIAVKVNLSSLNNSSIDLDNFVLDISNVIFKPTNEYSNDIVDVGDVYKGGKLTDETSEYFLVYKVDNKYLNDDFILKCYTSSDLYEIKLNPKKYNIEDKTYSYNLNDIIKFNDSLGDMSFNIINMEISDKYVLNYNYCIDNTTDCVNSKEIIKASIDENFDKYVLKLEIKYNNDGNKKFNSFYDLLDTFGSIYYKSNDKWIIQSDNFENITSKKTNQSNVVYIGVNKDIYNSSNIKFVFNIREASYEYVIR